MRFERFGVRLDRLAPEHLELVRLWRNSECVRPHMRDRKIVEPEDQARWFSRLSPIDDWYFCAHSDDRPFALFHVKAIDRDRRCGEAGGFVGDPSFIGGAESARAILALMDLAFWPLDLNMLEARYRADRAQIASLNEQLGYETCAEEPDGFVRARVTRSRYLACAAPFRDAAVTLYGSSGVLTGLDGAFESMPGAAQEWPPDFHLRSV